MASYRLGVLQGDRIANPVGMIGSVAVRLHWLAAERGDRAAGDAGLAIERAVARVLAGPTRTRDLGGTASTAEFTAALLRHLDA